MGQKINLATQVQGILPPQNGGTGSNYGLNFADAETPSGVINGSNKNFTLVNSPFPSASLLLFLAKQLQIQGTDYTIAANTISMVAAPSGSPSFVAWYRYQSAPLFLNIVGEQMPMLDALVNDATPPNLPLQVMDQMFMSDGFFILGPHAQLPLSDDNEFNWQDIVATSTAGIGIFCSDFIPLRDAVSSILNPTQGRITERMEMADSVTIHLV
jgi:hypothetical protein